MSYYKILLAILHALFEERKIQKEIEKKGLDRFIEEEEAHKVEAPLLRS